MTKPKKSPWTKAHRLQLSALLRPEELVPDGYYLSVEEAWERVGGTGPVPTQLDPAEERNREFSSSGRAPVTQAEDLKITCTSHYWNALMAFWSQAADFDFILDLAFPEPGTQIPRSPFVAAPNTFGFDLAPEFFAALRRYLHVASEEEYHRARLRVQPIMEPILSGDRPSAHTEIPYDEIEPMIIQGYLAYAFSRDTAWADRLLERAVNGEHVLSDNSAPAVIVACKDRALAKRVCEGFDYPDSVGGGRCEQSLVYHRLVFDFVESFGSDAGPMLEALRAGAQVPKKLGPALKLAQKLPPDASTAA